MPHDRFDLLELLEDLAKAVLLSLVTACQAVIDIQFELRGAPDLQPQRDLAKPPQKTL